MENHGGKRAGSGRKPTDPMLKRTPRNLLLPEWLWQLVDQQEGTRTAVIEPILKAALGEMASQPSNK